jgi:hypothetical protein
VLTCDRILFRYDVNDDVGYDDMMIVESMIHKIKAHFGLLEVRTLVNPCFLK